MIHHITVGQLIERGLRTSFNVDYNNGTYDITENVTPYGMSYEDAVEEASEGKAHRRWLRDKMEAAGAFSFYHSTAKRAQMVLEEAEVKSAIIRIHPLNRDDVVHVRAPFIPNCKGHLWVVRDIETVEPKIVEVVVYSFGLYHGNDDLNLHVFMKTKDTEYRNSYQFQTRHDGSFEDHYNTVFESHREALECTRDKIRDKIESLNKQLETIEQGLDK